MTLAKPTITPHALATLIDGAPDRVRRRLDREPTAASAWEWTPHESGWHVQAGGETLSLPSVPIVELEQVRCSCLLSPRCFHLLACLSSLEVADSSNSTSDAVSDVDLANQEQVSTAEKQASNDDSLVDEESMPRDDTGPLDNTVLLDDVQRRAVLSLERSVTQVLRVGGANTGVVLQADLLRGAHECRAVGLPRLAAFGLRIAAGIRELRARTATADPPQLADDVAGLLETARRLSGPTPVSAAWIGANRRPQLPIQPRKLHGLFAEPILTRSGFAGAAVYFLGEDDRFYSASDVRPGDAQLARNAYLGGIEFGPLVASGRQLAQHVYLGSDLTASPDGRLGKGKRIRVVEQAESTWAYEGVQRRFRRPLAEQWSDVFAQAELPEEARPAGWDFVFVSGRVLGAAGAELLLLVEELERPLRLAIAVEGQTFPFRENLRMLSRAPGLPLQVIARLIPHNAPIVFPLAVAPAASTDEPSPQLLCSPNHGGRISLGFDELQPQNLPRCTAAPVVVPPSSAAEFQDDIPWHVLHRRWLAALVSGFTAQRSTDAARESAEIATLTRWGLTTGASLVDRYRSLESRDPRWEVDTFIATAIYLRHCRFELARRSI